ncbi:MAG: TusE/DsrC/DsvC family sulfur relay protein [Nitrospirota bacterium]
MGSFESNGKVYQTHESGYVDGWDKEAASYLAKKENFDLTEERWRIVDFLREYYLVLTNLPVSEEYKILPMIEILVKGIEKKLGSEKANIKYLNELFPDGLTKQACKIAGIPKPRDGFDFNGKVYETDKDGYLVNIIGTEVDDWSKDVADYLAKEENVEMTDAHWQVVNFLREYYKEYAISPAIKILTKEVSKRFGLEKENTTKYLYELFPRSTAAQAAKIAGILKPGGCI